MSEKDLTRKKAVSIVESIFALALAILIIWWAISSLIFMISTKIGQWYNYAFVIIMGILCFIFGIVVGKDLLILILKLIRGGPPERKH